MISPLCKWCFHISWHKFEKRWAHVFQIYPNAIHLNPLQFCPSMPLLSFPVFCLSSSIVLNPCFHILVNYMTIWSVLKLPKKRDLAPFMHLSVAIPEGWPWGTPRHLHHDICKFHLPRANLLPYHSYFGLCLLYRAIYPVPAVWIFRFQDSSDVTNPAGLSLCILPRKCKMSGPVPLTRAKNWRQKSANP